MLEEVPLTPREGFRARGFAFSQQETAPRRKILVVVAVVVMVLAVVGGAVALGVVYGTRHARTHGGPNVVLMIGDGLGPQMTSLARLFAQHTKTLKDPLVPLRRAGCTLSLVTTTSASHLRTDSAAAATAFACGSKTNNGFVGVTPDGLPCGTVLEAAANAGLATGIAVTSTVSHATPAAFTAHAASRTDEQGIALEQLQQLADGKLHVAVGGGRDYWSAASRADGADLIAKARALGVTVALNRSAMDDAVNSGNISPLLALLAPQRLAYEIDLDDFRADVWTSDSESDDARMTSERPSTAEIATAAWKALKKITAGKRPFFLLVEGSLIDFAEHSNDASTAIWEVLAFFRAVAAIQRLAKEDGNTIVLVVADHDTGGLSLGGGTINFDLVSAANASIEAMADLILAGDNVTAVLGRYTAIHDLDAAEIAKLNEAAKCNASFLQDEIALIIADRIGISWGTDGHTATNVLLYSCLQALVDADADDSCDILMDNTDIAKWISTRLDLDLNATTAESRRRFNVTAANNNHLPLCYDDNHHFDQHCKF